MLLLIQIWVAVAVLGWGIILTLVGIGSHSLSKSRLRSNYPNIGASNLFPILLGMLTAGVGLALLVSALGWSPLVTAIDSLIAGALLLLGIQLATGHARFENNLSLTMIKWPKTDRGILARFIGIIVAVTTLIFLVASMGWFGWKMSPDLVVRIVDVCATLFAAILVNVVTGSAAPKSDVLRWLITGTGVVVFVLLLVQTPLLGRVLESPKPISTPVSSQKEKECDIVITSLHPAKINLRPNEKINVTVTIQSCGSAVTYVWSADNGTVDPSGLTNYSTISYTAPDFSGQDTIYVEVRDTDERSTTGQVTVSVGVLKGPGIIEPPGPVKGILRIGEQTQVTVKATCNPPCDPTQLTYAWRAEYGSITPAGRTDQHTITYTAPAAPGTDTVYVTVYDNQGNSVESKSSLITIISDDTPPPESYSVSISEPKTGSVECPGDGPCSVSVEGRFEGPNERQGLDVLALVLPVEPPGGAWWIQGGLILDRLDGTWSVIATLGEEKTPPVTGHKFSIRALLVEQSVADDPAYAPGVNLVDYTVIPRLAASERVNLDIQSP